VKLESSYVRLSNAKAGAACVNGWRLRRGLPYVLAAVCASVLLVGASAGDYYQCYQAGHCSPALSSPDACEEGRDYVVTVTNAGSGVTVLSFHGGKIEPGTSEISSEVARRYGWNRYDLNADGTSQCLSPYNNVSST
jgi:poly-gamma-glutamate hydrolase-like protein